MTWALALQLALKYGPEFVSGVISVIEQHGEPTAEAWAKVTALATKSYDSYIQDAQARAGLPPMPPAVTP